MGKSTFDPTSLFALSYARATDDLLLGDRFCVCFCLSFCRGLFAADSHRHEFFWLFAFACVQGFRLDLLYAEADGQNPAVSAHLLLYANIHITSSRDHSLFVT